MPLSLSTDTTIQKNKVTSSGVWLQLMTFTYGVEPVVRCCLNNTNVTWNGDLYYAVDFTPPTISETKDAEVHDTSFVIADVKRKISPLLKQYDGAVGAIVLLSVVHSDMLDHTVAEKEYEFEAVSTVLDAKNNITFTLGIENLSTIRCPQGRYLKNACRFKFKDDRCGYTGSETSCSLTFASCEEKGNQARFGGFPGVGDGGYFV